MENVYVTRSYIFLTGNKAIVLPMFLEFQLIFPEIFHVLLFPLKRERKCVSIGDFEQKKNRLNGLKC